MAVPSESTRCPAVTKAGARCKRSGDPYCSVHRKLERGTEKADLPGSVPPIGTLPAIPGPGTLSVPMGEWMKGLTDNMVASLHPQVPMEWMKGLTDNMVASLHPQVPMEWMKGLTDNMVASLHPQVPMEWMKGLTDNMVASLHPQISTGEWMKGLTDNMALIPQVSTGEWMKGLTDNMVTSLIPQVSTGEWMKGLTDNMVTSLIPQSTMSAWVKTFSRNVTLPKITDDALGAMAKAMLSQWESPGLASAVAAARSTSGVSTFKAVYSDSLNGLEAKAEPLEFAAAAVVATMPEDYYQEAPNQGRAQAVPWRFDRCGHLVDGLLRLSRVACRLQFSGLPDGCRAPGLEGSHHQGR
jgi:hypothetical protein